MGPHVTRMDAEKLVNFQGTIKLPEDIQDVREEDGVTYSLIKTGRTAYNNNKKSRTHEVLLSACCNMCVRWCVPVSYNLNMLIRDDDMVRKESSASLVVLVLVH